LAGCVRPLTLLPGRSDSVGAGFFMDFLFHAFFVGTQQAKCLAMS
jgi:hypothetical protein